MKKERSLLFSLTMKDFEIQTFRAGGKGGQNQNKVESGVRLIHRPSGARAESREHRKQLDNKKSAFRKLAADPLLQRWIRAKAAELQGTRLKEFTAPENESLYVRTVNYPRQQVKDSLTGVETGDVEGVMNGSIDLFIESRIRNGKENSHG